MAGSDRRLPRGGSIARTTRKRPDRHGLGPSAQQTLFPDALLRPPRPAERPGSFAAFVALYDAIDATTSTNAKVMAMERYFRRAPPDAAAWALFFLAGRRFLRLLPIRRLADWATDDAGLPDWLLGECYSAVGDLAETVALVVGEEEGGDEAAAAAPLADWVARILALRGLPETEQRRRVVDAWHALGRAERLVLGKLLTGELRVGVSATLVHRALARALEVPVTAIAERLMGEWRPEDGAALIERLGRPVDAEEDKAPALGDRSIAGDPSGDVGRPYPFCLASPLDVSLEGLDAALGETSEWLVEWKYDGIRAQLVVRGGSVYVWSRGEELVTDRFPEVVAIGRALPEGTVLDGEVLARRPGMQEPLPFAVLQRRIGRRALSPEVLEEAPVGFTAFDLLELGGRDLRALPTGERRARLEALLRQVDHPSLTLSPEVRSMQGWAGLAIERERARTLRVEGLMLKRRDAPYRAGRRRGDWWKWKLDPYTIDAVLMYAQPGQGRRASLLTDYTFGVWSGDPSLPVGDLAAPLPAGSPSESSHHVTSDERRPPAAGDAPPGAAVELVPIAKAYSGLTDDEIAEVDAWIRRHTLARFGPVRQVEPVLVFELACAGLAPSSRHRSGVALRFPRMARWRRDKQAPEADTIARVLELLDATK